MENSLKKERMQTELITNVSHDIKTPLTSILNYVGILRQTDPADPKVQDYLNILAAKEQIRATEASVAEAEEAYKIAEVRYSSGVGTNLDVLDAELQLSTARTNYISALYNYNIGLATLENAMGIPAVIHPEFAAGSENK